MDVTNSLTQADLEMQTAIDSFRRATRIGMLDMFRTSRSLSETCDEEAHVTYGITALLRAESHVAAVTERVTALPEGPAREVLLPSIRDVDHRFRKLINDMHDHPSPHHLIKQINRVRQAIPPAVAGGRTATRLTNRIHAPVAS